MKRVLGVERGVLGKGYYVEGLVLGRNQMAGMQVSPDSRLRMSCRTR